MSGKTIGSRVRGLIAIREPTRLLILGACLGLLSMSGACSANDKVELRAWIGMSAVEFNQQAGAQRLAIGLSEEHSDFWGTDNALKLVLVLPEGELVLDYGNQMGVYITSRGDSFLHNPLPSPSIKSISGPAGNSIVSIPQDLPDLLSLCDELQEKLGQNFRQNSPDEQRLAAVEVGEPVPEIGLFLCRFESEDQEVSVTIRAREADDRYFTSIHWNEIIPID